MTGVAEPPHMLAHQPILPDGALATPYDQILNGVASNPCGVVHEPPLSFFFFFFEDLNFKINILIS
jgi:hypothetical protein